MPKIAIDYTPAYQQGAGIGRYVRELINALAHLDNQTDYRLFVSGAKQSDLGESIGTNFKWKPTVIPSKWLTRIWHRANVSFPINLLIGDVDLYHATDFVLPPLSKGTKSVLTVHDLSFVRVPESASPKLKRYLDYIVPLSIKRAEHILADSQATKDDIVDLYSTSPDKISVLLSGVDTRFQPSNQPIETISRKYNFPQKPYVLCVGTVQPRKNYERVITACRSLLDEGLDFNLLIAGGKGWLDAPIYQTIESLNMSQYVHFLGFVDDADLPALYTHAQCLAFPSLYEGFGLPILESMACGTPVLTSNISSLPEVAGDIAITVDPYNIDAIHDGIRQLMMNGKNVLQGVLNTFNNSLGGVLPSNY
jgi:glycosyltransferase involved in cell wall biosynthesis